MSRQIQIRRGTSAEHNNFTGAIGEITMDTTNKTLRIHDGTTIGGNEIMSVNKFQTNITNCITNISQDINLIISSGTLVLKSGSKIYVPNGSNSFNTVTLTSDLSDSADSTRTVMVFVNSSNHLMVMPAEYCFSGSTAPTSFYGDLDAVWYDTANNIVKYTSDAGSTWTSGISLPLGIVTETTTAYTVINKIFNGFGYIGKTVFALPGIKGLISNGINDNGTLKNTIYSLSSVATGTITETGNIVLISNGTLGVSRLYAYNTKTNYVYNTNTGTNYTNRFICGSVEFSNNTVTSFVSKQVFHALDYSDTDFIAHQAMPSNNNSIALTIGASGTVYTAPFDGYYFGRLECNSDGYIQIVYQNGYKLVWSVPGNIQQQSFILPVLKGTQITLNYTNRTNSVYQFLVFVPSEGSK